MGQAQRSSCLASRSRTISDDVLEATSTSHTAIQQAMAQVVGGGLWLDAHRSENLTVQYLVFI